MATVIQQQPGGTVIDTGPPPPPNRCCHYATAVLSFLTGGGLFILGIVVIAALPDAGSSAWAKNSGTGMWVGAIIAFTGMLGVASTWKWHNKVLRGFYIALGVISTILSFVAIIICIVATLFYSVECDLWRAVNALQNKADTKAWCADKDLAIGLHVVMMLFCGFEFIVSIVGGCLACACCCQSGSRTVVVAPQPMAMAPPPQQPPGYTNAGYQQPPPQQSGYPAPQQSGYPAKPDV